MIFQFYFKRLNSSNFLKDLSERKIQDVLERFQGHSSLVHVTFAKEKNQHLVQCRVRGLNGRSLYASAASDSVFAGIDAVAQKLEAQLARWKVRTEPQMRSPREAMQRFMRGSEPAFEGAERDDDPSFRFVN